MITFLGLAHTFDATQLFAVGWVWMITLLGLVDAFDATQLFGAGWVGG